MWVKYYRKGYETEWSAVPVDRYATKEQREAGAAVPYDFGDGAYDIFDLYDESTDDVTDPRYVEWCRVVLEEIAPAFERADIGAPIIREINGDTWVFENADLDRYGYDVN